MTIAFEMSPTILQKLRELFGSLVHAKKSYEELAFGLRDRQLQQTVIGLAQESRQYATELDSFIHTLGFDMGQGRGEEEIPVRMAKNLQEPPETREQKDIIHYCVHSEKSILLVYRDLLNEPYLYEGIRKMVRYQLNGLMHSFAQLKMLGASLRTR